MANNKASFLALIGQPPGEPGRALKYDADLHCQMVRDLAQQGDFPESWAAEIGITISTMRRWVHEHEEFREAIIIARHLLQSFWTRDIAKNRTNPDSKPGLYNLIARRFPELYGREPVDLFAWLQTPDAVGSEGLTQPGQAPMINPLTGAPATEADIMARLEALRRRREEEGGV